MVVEGKIARFSKRGEKNKRGKLAHADTLTVKRNKIKNG
jgi:hypothetical protein